MLYDCGAVVNSDVVCGFSIEAPADLLQAVPRAVAETRYRFAYSIRHLQVSHTIERGRVVCSLKYLQPWQLAGAQPPL